jgi:hypothetical protein
MAERLNDEERPVAVAGVLRAHDLLGSPDSPLYRRERSAELPGELTETLSALDKVA